MGPAPTNIVSQTKSDPTASQTKSDPTVSQAKADQMKGGPPAASLHVKMAKGRHFESQAKSGSGNVGPNKPGRPQSKATKLPREKPTKVIKKGVKVAEKPAILVKEEPKEEVEEKKVARLTRPAFKKTAKGGLKSSAKNRFQASDKKDLWTQNCTLFSKDIYSCPGSKNTLLRYLLHEICILLVVRISVMHTSGVIHTPGGICILRVVCILLLNTGVMRNLLEVCCILHAGYAHFPCVRHTGGLNISSGMH